MNIFNTGIDITAGSIYYSAHFVQSDIILNDISITTNQLQSDNSIGLMYFLSTDIVNITNMSILYTYDTVSECYYDSTITNDAINGSCDVFRCANQVMLIQNYGEVCNDTNISLCPIFWKTFCIYFFYFVSDCHELGGN